MNAQTTIRQPLECQKGRLQGVSSTAASLSKTPAKFLAQRAKHAINLAHLGVIGF